MRNLIYISIFLLLILGCKETPPEEIPPVAKPYGEFIDDWTFSVNVSSQSAYNFDIAQFRLWVPEEIENLRAIAILASSHNSNGLGLVNIPEWQEFAQKEKVALMGIYFRTDPGRTIYTAAAEGSGNALMQSLDSITTRNNLPEIKDLPFLMRGYSAGGVFSYQFSAFQPDRVIAFVNVRGGSLTGTSDVNVGIPALMIMGENDAASRNDRIQSTVLQKRAEGGLWGFATEPEVDHFGGLGPSDELIRSFFAIALAKRDIENSNELAPIAESSGWLGNNESKDIQPFDSYLDDRDDASWLIDETFAKEWQKFQ